MNLITSFLMLFCISSQKIKPPCLIPIASEYMGILDHVPEVDKDLKEDQILKITVQTPALWWLSHSLT